MEGVNLRQHTDTTALAEITFVIPVPVRTKVFICAYNQPRGTGLTRYE